MSVAIAAGALVAIPAWADHDRTEQKPVGQISAEAMKQKIDELGYEVRRLEAEHGHFDAHIVERQSGGAVKARFDSNTGELVRAEPHD